MSKPSPNPLRLYREADALLRGLEDDEGSGLAGAQLLEQIIVHHHFRDATVGQAADEPGPADIHLVDLEAKPGRQQHPHRGDHPHQLGFVISGLEDDDSEADIGAIFRGHALNEGALLALGSGRSVATDLPIIVDRFYRTLGGGLIRRSIPNGKHHGAGEHPLGGRAGADRARK